MRNYYLYKIPIFIIFFIFVNFVNGQTINKLNEKYGKPIITYDIRPGLNLTVIYNEYDGKIKRMIIQDKFYREDAIDFRVHLNNEIVKELIDELVPNEIRGKKDENYGLSLITGQSGFTYYGYENVSITFYNSSSDKRAVLVIDFIK